MEAALFFGVVAAIVGVAMLLVRYERGHARRVEEYRRVVGDWARACAEEAERTETEPLSLAGWDGTTGLRVAVGIRTAKGNLFPLLRAGEALPARVEDQHVVPEGGRALEFELYAGLQHREVIGCDFLGAYRIEPPKHARRIRLVLSVDTAGKLSVVVLSEGSDPIAVHARDERTEPLPTGTTG